MTEQDYLDAWRTAIAETNEAEMKQHIARYLVRTERERLAARAYLAARDRAVAAQGRDEAP